MAHQLAPRKAPLVGIDRPPPTSRRHGSTVAIVDGAPGRLSLSPVVLVLLGVLTTLLWVKLSGVHLDAGQRLGALVGPSPFPSLSATQLGKVVALCGLASLCGGAILIALHWPHEFRDRLLARRCLCLLGCGAALAILLDLAPAIVANVTIGRMAQLAETLVKWLVIGGSAALLAQRSLAWRQSEPGRAAGLSASKVSAVPPSSSPRAGTAIGWQHPSCGAQSVRVP